MAGSEKPEQQKAFTVLVLAPPFALLNLVIFGGLLLLTAGTYGIALPFALGMYPLVAFLYPKVGEGLFHVLPATIRPRATRRFVRGASLFVGIAEFAAIVGAFSAWLAWEYANTPTQ